VQVRQRAAELVHGALAEALPNPQDSAVDPGQERAMALLHLDDELAVARGDRPRDAHASPLEVLCDKREELELGADMCSLAVRGPVDPEDMPPACIVVDPEDRVVQEPDGRQLGVRWHVVCLKSHTRKTLLLAYQLGVHVHP
jgi:hypothetical protein